MTPAETDPARLAGIRRGTLLILSLGQILSGIAFGATISLGAVLAGEVSVRDDLSGLATAAVTLGAAAFAVPLARLAQARGRRPALATGMLIALVGVALVVAARHFNVFALLLTAFVLIGVAT